MNKIIWILLISLLNQLHVMAYDTLWFQKQQMPDSFLRYYQESIPKSGSNKELPKSTFSNLSKEKFDRILGDFAVFGGEIVGEKILADDFPIIMTMLKNAGFNHNKVPFGYEDQEYNSFVDLRQLFLDNNLKDISDLEHFEIALQERIPLYTSKGEPFALTAKKKKNDFGINHYLLRRVKDFNQAHFNSVLEREATYFESMIEMTPRAVEAELIGYTKLLVTALNQGADIGLISEGSYLRFESIIRLLIIVVEEGDNIILNYEAMDILGALKELGVVPYKYYSSFNFKQDNKTDCYYSRFGAEDFKGFVIKTVKKSKDEFLKFKLATGHCSLTLIIQKKGTKNYIVGANLNYQFDDSNKFINSTKLARFFKFRNGNNFLREADYKVSPETYLYIR